MTNETKEKMRMWGYSFWLASGLAGLLMYFVFVVAVFGTAPESTTSAKVCHRLAGEDVRQVIFICEME